ncbi:hypothetical protein HD806DRAFT_349618 [Xylariaceae sp. AK1471]|nr:hypothetical protein HD806DRAFT_349618 [Xylariaceae sp. AK1471]
MTCKQMIMATPKIAIPLSIIPVTVYESDASPNYRGQGGTLDLHLKMGLAAVKIAHLWDEFNKLARFNLQYTNMYNRTLKPYIRVNKTGTQQTSGLRLMAPNLAVADSIAARRHDQIGHRL